MGINILQRCSWRTLIKIIIYIVGIYCILVMTFFVVAVYKSSHWEHRRQISNRLGYYNSNNGGYIYDLLTDEIVIPDVSFIVEPKGNDSIAIFHWGVKRGYFNINNGMIVAQPQYDAAWIFKSGVGGVAINDSVFFIGLNGKPINDKKFPRIKGENYIYNGNYCIIKSGNYYGAIDKFGEWFIEPEWNYIEIEPNGLLTAWSNGFAVTVYDKNKIQVFPDRVEIKGDTIYSYSDSIRVYIRQYDLED